MATNFRKLPTGNYQGRNGKYYAFIKKMPHGKWAADISLGGDVIAAEGYHTTSLHTVSKAMAWVEIRIKRQEK